MNIDNKIEESKVRMNALCEQYKKNKLSGNIALSIQVNFQFGGISVITREIKEFDTEKEK